MKMFPANTCLDMVVGTSFMSQYSSIPTTTILFIHQYKKPY